MSLLSDGEMLKAVNRYPAHAQDNNWRLTDRELHQCIRVAEAQHAKDKAECDKREKEIFEEIEEVADMEGGHHTFKGKAVEDCVLIPKTKWQALKAGKGGEG